MKIVSRRLIGLLFFVLLMGWALSPNAPAVLAKGKGKDISIKVMSYNMAHGRGMDGVVDLSRIAKVIRDSGAEVIGLQEVDKHWSSRSDFVDQAKWLAEELDMHYVYGPNLDRDPLQEGDPRRQYGNAVLSKYPIIQHENHQLTTIHVPGKNNEQRGVLEAVINIKGNHLRFFSTHLGLKEEERMLSVEEIFAIEDMSEKDSIFVGDFNAKPDSPEMIEMSERFNDVFAELDMDDAFTFPAPYVNPDTGKVSTPSSRIDFIFANENLEHESAERIETAAADHMPIVATFTLKREHPQNNGENK